MKEKIEDLSNQTLSKRSRFFSIILGIVYGLAIISVASYVYTDKSELLASTALLIIVSSILLKQKKRIKNEIEKRSES